MTSAHHPVGSTSRRPSCSEMNRPRPTASSNRILIPVVGARTKGSIEDPAGVGNGHCVAEVRQQQARWPRLVSHGRSSRATGFERRCFRPCAESVEIDAPPWSSVGRRRMWPTLGSKGSNGRSNRPKHHCTLRSNSHPCRPRRTDHSWRGSVPWPPLGSSHRTVAFPQSS